MFYWLIRLLIGRLVATFGRFVVFQSSGHLRLVRNLEGWIAKKWRLPSSSGKKLATRPGLRPDPDTATGPWPSRTWWWSSAAATKASSTSCTSTTPVSQSLKFSATARTRSGDRCTLLSGFAMHSWTRQWKWTQKFVLKPLFEPKTGWQGPNNVLNAFLYHSSLGLWPRSVGLA